MSERISDERLAELADKHFEAVTCLAPEVQMMARELQTLRREREWRPIETAPQDVWVIGWNADAGARQTINCLYAKGSTAHTEDPQARYWNWEEPQSHWTSSWQPSHWLPLPVPLHV